MAVVEIVADGTFEDAVVPAEVVPAMVVPAVVVPAVVVPAVVVPAVVVPAVVAPAVVVPTVVAPAEVVPAVVVPAVVVPAVVAPAEVVPAVVVPAVVVPAVIVPAVVDPAVVVTAVVVPAEVAPAEVVPAEVVPEEVVPEEVVPVEVAPAEVVALAPGLDDSTVLDVEKVESLDLDGASTSLLPVLDSEDSIAAEALVLGVGVLFDMDVEAVVEPDELVKLGEMLGDLEEGVDVEELSCAGTVSGEALVPVLGVGLVSSAWVKLWRGGNATSWRICFRNWRI